MPARHFLLGIVMMIFGGCSAHVYPPLQTVEKVDINRYSGSWIEIARYENRFEDGCYGASASYTLQEGGLEVLNRCYNQQGEQISQAKGKAYATDRSNTKLKVTFFWPFYGDYHVILLADDYRYSVVGEPSRKYLWILSRTKDLKEGDQRFILRKLQELGYDTSRLYWTIVRSTGQ